MIFAVATIGAGVVPLAKVVYERLYLILMARDYSGRQRAASFCFFVFVAFFLTTVSFTNSQALAQSDRVSTSISPVTFELAANPGETITNIVKVTNLSDVSVTYKMGVQPFVGNESGQATVLTEDNDPNPELALSDWTTLSPKTFPLAPKEQKLVTVTIKIPKDAEPGGRYASVLASSTNDSTLEGGGATVNQKVGTLVLLRVQGAIKYKAYIKEFGATQKLFERSPVTLKTRIHNDSTVHIKPKGFVTVTNLFGKKVIEQPYEERNALPSSDRLIYTELKNRLGTGYYTANLAIVYGDRNEQLLSTTSFYVFPWKVGVPIVIGSLLILIFLIARRRRIVAAIRILAGKQ